MDIKITERSVILIAHDVIVDGIPMPRDIVSLLEELEDYSVQIEPSAGRNWLIEQRILEPHQFLPGRADTIGNLSAYFRPGPEFQKFKGAVSEAIRSSQEL